MTLKLEGDLPVDKARHSKLLKLDEIRMERNEKNTKITLKIKGQGQISPTSKHF